MISYRHSQIGYFMIVTLGAAALVAFWLLRGQRDLLLLGIVAILVVTLLLFYRLTVSVDAQTLTLWFGLGWPKRKFFLDEIAEVNVKRKPWYSGWGIRRLVRDGWLFNVSGNDVVELKLKDGRRFLIGTDEPQALALAIRQGMGQRP